MMENKTQFIEDLNTALIKNGNGRYDYLLKHPLTYDPDFHGEEAVYCQGLEYRVACVSMDSLTAMLYDICKEGVL